MSLIAKAGDFNSIHNCMESITFLLSRNSFHAFLTELTTNSVCTLISLLPSSGLWEPVYMLLWDLPLPCKNSPRVVVSILVFVPILLLLKLWRGYLSSPSRSNFECVLELLPVMLFVILADLLRRVCIRYFGYSFSMTGRSNGQHATMIPVP